MLEHHCETASGMKEALTRVLGAKWAFAGVFVFAFSVLMWIFIFLLVSSQTKQ